MTRELTIHAKPFESGGGLVAWLVIGFLTLAIRIYQLSFSPVQSFLFGATNGCRYTPSCSTYAVDAFGEHGVVAGSSGWPPGGFAGVIPGADAVTTRCRGRRGGAGRLRSASWFAGVSGRGKRGGRRASANLALTWGRCTAALK